MKIIEDDLQGEAVLALLQEHFDDMYATSPPESVHTLNISELRQPHITFWSIWDSQGSEMQLAGCVALKEHNSELCEIKSMRTAKTHHRKGVASILLKHIIAIAQQRGYQHISLETGIEDYFTAARALYRKFGFTECDPFADYQPDPNSVFMTLGVAPEPGLS